MPHVNSPNSRPGSLASALLAACVIFPTGLAWGAEKIEFSNKPGKVDLPPAKSGDASKGSPFDFLKQTNPGGGFVEPLATPSINKGAVSKRLSEYLDQKKNWMFVDPKKSEKSTLNELFKGDGEKPESMGNRPKKAVEKFLEGDQAKNPDGTNTVSNTSTNEAHLTDDKSTAGDRDDKKRSQKGEGKDNNNLEPSQARLKGEEGLGPDSKQANKFLGGFPGAKFDTQFSTAFGDAYTGSGSSQENSLRSRQSLRDERLGQLYRTTAGPAPGTNPDPINSQADSTSTAANPILPVPGSSIASRPTVSKPAFNSINATLPTLAGPGRNVSLEDMATRSLNPIAPTPSFQPAATPSYAQPKPGILDFPRRRF